MSRSLAPAGAPEPELWSESLVIRRKERRVTWAGGLQRSRLLRRGAIAVCLTTLLVAGYASALLGIALSTSVHFQITVPIMAAALLWMVHASRRREQQEWSESRQCWDVSASPDAA